MRIPLRIFTISQWLVALALNWHWLPDTHANKNQTKPNKSNVPVQCNRCTTLNRTANSGERLRKAHDMFSGNVQTTTWSRFVHVIYVTKLPLCSRTNAWARTHAHMSISISRSAKIVRNESVGLHRTKRIMHLILLLLLFFYEVSGKFSFLFCFMFQEKLVRVFWFLVPLYSMRVCSSGKYSASAHSQNASIRYSISSGTVWKTRNNNRAYCLLAASLLP